MWRLLCQDRLLRATMRVFRGIFDQRFALYKSRIHASYSNLGNFESIWNLNTTTTQPPPPRDREILEDKEVYATRRALKRAFNPLLLILKFLLADGLRKLASRCTSRLKGFTTLKWSNGFGKVTEISSPDVQLVFKMVEENPNFLDVWLTYKSQVYLFRYVNSKSAVFWGSMKQDFVIERQLHPEKCTAWGAISKNGIIVPFWIEDKNQIPVTVNSDHYLLVLNKIHHCSSTKFIKIDASESTDSDSCKT